MSSRPRAACHRMRLSVSSSASSTSSSGSFERDFGPVPLPRIADVGQRRIQSDRAGCCSGTALYGVRSGSSVKQLAIGVAEASSWFIGGRPRISSIVRTMLVWL